MTVIVIIIIRADYHTQGAELVETVMDVVRKEAEGCDLLQVSFPIISCYIVSSEGALYVILPYDYPAAAARPLFEHTPVLNNNFEY